MTEKTRLTAEEYEYYQKQLKDLEVKISVLEEKQRSLRERLQEDYGLTVEQAQERIKELEETLPEKERLWAEKFAEFKKLCESLETN